MRFMLKLSLLLLPALCWGQFSSTASAIKKGTSLPSKCSAGAAFIKTAAPNAGQYFCNPADTWNQLGPAGAGTSAGSAAAVQSSNGSGGFSDSGCTATLGVMTCSNGFVGSGILELSGSEQAKPSAPAAGKLLCWADSTDHTLECQNSAGAVVGKLLLVGTTASTVAAGNDSRITGAGQLVAYGQTAMPTGALSANSCSASATTATATGAATTDAILTAYAADPTGVTGYGGGTSGGITIRYWLTTNTMNFKLCNETAGSITPGSLSINWRIIR